jgi:hypothetical protein
MWLCGCVPMAWCSLKVIGTTQRKAKGGKIRSSWETTCDIWRADGIKGFFYGAEGQVFNASVKQGLTIMMKERLQFLAFRLLMPSYLERLSATM